LRFLRNIWPETLKVSIVNHGLGLAALLCKYCFWSAEKTFRV
jgi:hypothetical protein